jgi:hypothetical protein
VNAYIRREILAAEAERARKRRDLKAEAAILRELYDLLHREILPAELRGA